jgi:hypothetical protein
MFSVPQTQSLECATCRTVYTVGRDEDLPGENCQDQECGIRLCPFCLDHFSFCCDGCGGRFCNDHVHEADSDSPCECERIDVDYYDARGCPAHDPHCRPRPLKFCAVCFNEGDEGDRGEWPEIPVLEPITLMPVKVNLPEWNEVA